MMNDLINEKPLNDLLLSDDNERRILAAPGSRWGELILPARDENPHKSHRGMKILAVTSYLYGYLLLEVLKECERRYPDRLNIVGMVTDDPVNTEAKISAKKRIWRLYNSSQQLNLEKHMIESALSFGVPCYTGEIKTSFFMKLLKHWNPEAILVFVFGQFFNKEIIEYAPYGIYNFHPADLANHYGAGPQPFEDMIARRAATSRLTIHHITEDVDAGHIVGQSPPVNIRMKDGTLTNDVLLLEDKMTGPVENMTAKLISELITKKESGSMGKTGTIDFEQSFSDDEKVYLMRPIESEKHINELPDLSDKLKFFC
ncbi:MAG: hypothetical protein JXA03_05100 [Bacteroidales bacterium]|nr:hypothetical protein [Bacteroidales bacterium]